MIREHHEPDEDIAAHLRAQVAGALRLGRRLAAMLGDEPLLLTFVPGGNGQRPDGYLMRIGAKRGSPLRVFATAEDAASAFVESLPAEAVAAALDGPDA